MKKMEFKIPNQQSQVVWPNLECDDDTHVGGDSNVVRGKWLKRATIIYFGKRLI